MTLEEMGQAIMARLTDLHAGLPQLSEMSNGHERSTDGLVERMLRPPEEDPTELGALLDTFQDAAEHALDTAGPGYLAYFPAGGLFSSAFAELLAQAYNRFTAVAELAPALVALEHGVMRWLAEQFGLPDTAIGVMTTGGSMATLAAMVAARDDKLGEDIASGTIYVTEHTHYCVAKAARIAGIRAHQLRTVPVTDLRMDPVQARSMIAADRARGRRPFLLVGTAGSTSAGTIDPMLELAELTCQEDLWFHVDAAYGGGFSVDRPRVGAARRDRARRLHRSRSAQEPLRAVRHGCASRP
jgi:aromatic-L-amino-acid decarboxylase